MCSIMYSALANVVYHVNDVFNVYTRARGSLGNTHIFQA